MKELFGTEAAWILYITLILLVINLVLSAASLCLKIISNLRMSSERSVVFDLMKRVEGLLNIIKGWEHIERILTRSRPRTP